MSRSPPMTAIPAELDPIRGDAYPSSLIVLGTSRMQNNDLTNRSRLWAGIVCDMPWRLWPLRLPW